MSSDSWPAFNRDSARSHSVPGFPEVGVAWNHFGRLHWVNSILILEDHPRMFLHCELCGRLVPPWLINNWHYNSEACQLGQERRWRRETLHRSFEKNWVMIMFNLEPLKSTTAFHYLVLWACIIIATGQWCISILGSLGGYGGWYQSCWGRWWHLSGTRIWCIRRFYMRCFCMVERYRWLWTLLSQSWRASITRFQDIL